MLGVLGAAAFGAGGGNLLSFSEGEARRRRKGKKKKRKNQPQRPALVPNVAITAITVATTAEAAHDDIVVQFINKGTQAATGFRIGMSAQRSDGTVRGESNATAANNLRTVTFGNAVCS